MKRKWFHTRREFFKITAQKALPVIGLLSIAKVPLFGQILNDGTLDCNGGCSNTCRNTAKGMCDTCSHQCFGGCQNTSKGKVQDSTEINNDTVKKTGCNFSCKDECKFSCGVRCQGTCTGTCLGCCKGSCGQACDGHCIGSCSGNCKNHVDLM